MILFQLNQLSPPMCTKTLHWVAQQIYKCMK
uniref:Uncharacterized protein n=1 Tax=Anguilla anguilla TaxID=7936 RepID=A0A0E9XKR3_ANGAN